MQTDANQEETTRPQPDTVALRPFGPISAGSFGTWEFAITIGQPLEADDSIEIVFATGFSTHAWLIPQVHDPTAPGYTTAHSECDAVLELSVTAKPNAHVIRSHRYHVLSCRVVSGIVPASASVVFTYGDRSGGGRGGVCQPVAGRAEFPVWIVRGGKERLADVTDSEPRRVARRIREAASLAPVRITAEVKGGVPARLHVVAPSVATAGHPLRMRVAAVDAVGNNASDWHARSLQAVLLDSGRSHIATMPVAVETAERTGERTFTLTTEREGFFYVCVIDPDLGIAGVSNPMRTYPENRQNPNQRRPGIFWGDLHAHSRLSDGMFEPNDHYHYARCVAGLDFAAVTDHGPTDLEIWKQTVAAARRWTDPGRFIAVPANEPSLKTVDGRSCPGNLYYLHAPEEPLLGPIDETFWAQLTKAQGVYIPHHTHYGFSAGLDDWETLRHAPSGAVPCVEVYSNHGCSEGPDTYRPLVAVRGESYQSALRQGFRFGVVAASDYHELPLGALQDITKFPRDSVNQHFQYRGGLTAAILPNLDLPDLIQALQRRTCYATTGPRIWLQCDLAGAPMGSDAAVGSDLSLHIEAAGTDRIARVEVVVDNETVYTLAGGEYVFTALLDLNRHWTPGGPHFVYLRLFQQDGEAAWTSPIWFTTA